MEIKQTYRTPYMSIDMCKKEDGTWMILLTKCTGQKIENYKNWNEAQKGLSNILWLTNAIKADRK